MGLKRAETQSEKSASIPSAARRRKWAPAQGKEPPPGPEQTGPNAKCVRSGRRMPADTAQENRGGEAGRKLKTSNRPASRRQRGGEKWAPAQGNEPPPGPEQTGPNAKCVRGGRRMPADTAQEDEGARRAENSKRENGQHLVGRAAAKMGTRPRNGATAGPRANRTDAKSAWSGRRRPGRDGQEESGG